MTKQELGHFAKKGVSQIAPLVQTGMALGCLLAACLQRVSPEVDCGPPVRHLSKFGPLVCVPRPCWKAESLPQNALAFSGGIPFGTHANCSIPPWDRAIYMCVPPCKWPSAGVEWHTSGAVHLDTQKQRLYFPLPSNHSQCKINTSAHIIGWWMGHWLLRG